MNPSPNYILHALSILMMCMGFNNHHNTNDNNCLNCSIDCSIFDQPQYFPCQSDFPPIHTFFLDFKAMGNEDIQAFISIGGSLNDCVDISIQAHDLIVHLPQDCADSLVVDRIYRFFDGPNLLEECTQTFITLEPPIRIVQHAQDKIVDCSENVDSLLNEWLSNYGQTEVFECSGISELNSLPMNPVILFDQCRTHFSFPYVERVIGDVRVRWNYIDGCGIEVSTVAGFFIVDTIAPKINCPSDLTFDLGENNLFEYIELVIDQIDALELCNEYIISNDFESSKIIFDCEEEQIIPLVFIARDSCGNMSSCSSNLSIFNTSPPEIACPNPLTLQCGQLNNLNLVQAWLNSAMAMDNLETLVPISPDFNEILLDSPFCNQDTDIMFLATDNCGKTNTCSSKIIIQDTLAPTVICPPSFFTSYSNINLENDLNSWLQGFSALDNCNTVDSTLNLDVNDIVFNCVDVSELIIFTAEDFCGNVNRCQSSLNIVNDYYSELICNTPLLLYCGNQNNFFLLENWLNQVQGIDILGSNLEVQNDLDLSDFTLFECHGPLEVNFSFTDLCGNIQSCTESFIVLDTLAPEIKCPTNLTIQSSPITQTDDIQLWLNDFTTQDNCSDVSVVNSYTNGLFDGCDLVISKDISFTVFDNCGYQNSCTSNLTIEIEKFPSVMCPSSLTIQCGHSENNNIIDEWILTSTGNDFQGFALSVTNNFNFLELENLSCNQEMQISFYVKDNCNYGDTCTTTIGIKDFEIPNIICPTMLNINSSDPHYESKIDQWLFAYRAEDNCTDVIVLNNLDRGAFNICDLSTIVVNFVVTDQCNLSNECNAIITINHDAPKISCPPKYFIECSSDSEAMDAEINSLLTLATASNNNGDPIQNISNDYVSNSLSISCDATILVTLKVQDNCKSESKCTVTIEQNDTTSPVLICPIESTIDIDVSNVQMEVDNWLENYTSVDACLSTSTINDFDNELSDFNCGGLVEVNFISVDECNNSSTCKSAITFTNKEVIDINCPPDLKLKCFEYHSTVVNDFLNEYSVTASNSYEVINDFEFVPYLCDVILIQEIQFFVTDICGNTDYCETSITIIPDPKAYLPNTFTPNGDGNNDYFTLFGNAFISNIISMNIYSRWGEIVFTKNNFPPNIAEEGWDGRINSVESVQGLYLYLIEYEDDQGNVLKAFGEIQLFR